MIRIYEILNLYPVALYSLLALVLVIALQPVLIHGLAQHLLGSLNECPENLKLHWKLFHSAKWACLIVIGCSVIAYKLGV